MGATANYALRYPELADPPNVQNDLKNLALDVDTKIPGVPIGASADWDYGAAQIPSWAILQYGQAVSRAGYPALHALASAASYPHGNGDGSSTFNIADKRGRVCSGKDDMGGTAASRITAAISGTAGTVLGAAVGSEGVTLATAQMPSHSHLGNTNWASANHSHTANTGYVSADHSHGVGDPSHSHGNYRGQGWYNSGYPASTDQGANQQQNDWGTWGAGTGQYVNWFSADHTHTIGTNWTGTNHQHQVYAQGGGGAHLTMQPTIIVNKIVRAL
jgi:microcystin-dependent protein